MVAATLSVITLPVLGTPAAATAATPKCPAVAATLAAAQVDAKTCRGKVEVLSARSEYSQGFVNPDGTTTVTSSAVPARVHRADGSWAAVDTTLAMRGKGGYAPRATLADVVFSAGGTAPFITYRSGNQKLTLSWPGTLSTPIVSGDSLVYPDVFAGVDLLVAATPTGFREALIVKTAAAAKNPALQKIKYRVGGTVKLAATTDGRVRFADISGRTIVIASDATMWDSTVDPEMAGEVETGVDVQSLRAKASGSYSAKNAGANAGLVSTASGPSPAARVASVSVSASRDRLLLTPDASLLHAADVTFPIFIDPSIGPVDTKFAYADDANVNNSPGGKARMGLSPGDGNLYRSFFDFPTTSGSLTFKGKHVLSAEFNIELYHSWSCDSTPAYLFRPNGNITVSNNGRMAWSTRPLGSSATYLASASGHANKAGGCGGVAQPDMLMTFSSSGMTNDVQYAATHNFTTYSVGLCACTSSGSGESTTDRWKKFYVDSRVTLSVTYNTKPGTPANLTVAGVACGGYVGTTSPTLKAQYVDADTGDTLTASFKWQQLPAGTVTTVAGPAKPANNYGSPPALNLGSGAEGQTYQFQVRTNDGHDSSPWSAWCQFTVNSIAPIAPVIASTSYPACDPSEIGTCVASGGPGVSGSFGFSEPAGSGGASVTTYVYGWTNPPTTSIAAIATGGPSPTMTLTPPRYGLNTLYVYSMNGAGTPSPTSTWQFLVGAPSAPLADWPLDDIRNHGYSDQMGGTALAVDPVSNDVTWTPDAHYVGAEAASINRVSDGIGGALTATTTLDTSESFSVSAWLRVGDLSNWHTAVSKDGTQMSVFRLQYRTDQNKWCFTVRAKDVPGAQLSMACGPTPSVNRWTQLVGVYDDAEQTLTLYVDGIAYTTTMTSSFLTDWAGGWNPSGKLAVGRAEDSGNHADQFTGEISDVMIWNRVLTVDDVVGTDADPGNGVPAVVGLLNPTQVGSWDFEGGVDCYCDNVLDGAYFGRALSLDPGWQDVPPSSSFIYDGHDGNDAVTLDGSSGEATTTLDGVTHPVIRTDQSYTVSAWVRLAPACSGTSDTIIAQDGVHVSAFALEYNCGTGVYAFWVAAADTVNPSHPRASGISAAQPGEWTFVTGVYDAVEGQVRLYVDGVWQSTVTAPATSFYATGSLTVGRQRYGDVSAGHFAGDIDQVQIWQGVLNDQQIADLESGD